MGYHERPSIAGIVQRARTGLSRRVAASRPAGGFKQGLLNETSRRVLFEALERRQLLSAELNPIAGSIDVPGETDRYTFSLAEHQKFYFDSETPNAGLTWSLTGPAGTAVTNRSLASSDGAGLGTASPILDLVSGDYTLSVSGSAEAEERGDEQTGAEHRTSPQGD